MKTQKELLVLNRKGRSLLDPARLASQAEDSIREIIAEGSSANTLRSYRAALQYWATWFLGRYGVPMKLPVPVPAVLQFIADHTPRSKPRARNGLVWDLPSDLDAQLVAAGVKKKTGCFKITTLTHRIAVLSKTHKLAAAKLKDRDRFKNPCEDPEVREVLSKARRASIKRQERPRKKKALTRDLLAEVLATCDDSLEGLRDRALLCFAFSSGGRRRSEVAAADLRDLHTVGPDEYSYFLPNSKTRQAGPTAGDAPYKSIQGTAGKALSAWLAASNLTEGAIFRRILYRKRIGEALSPDAVAEIVKRRAARAGLLGDFGGHSPRSGFVTEGAIQGVPLAEIMAMTEHTSVPTVLGYFQEGAARNNKAARLLDD